jgi:threonine dehydrogenase-like Zn-dependent dehydrogenase
MRAVASPEPDKVEIVDVPMPSVRDYECLVRVEACGLCNGTDLKIISGKLSGMSVDYPVILGHEGVGEVVEVGSAVRNIEVGQRFLNPHGRLEPGTPYSRMFAGMVEYAIVQDHAAMDEMGVDRAEYTGFAARPVPDGIPPADCGVLLQLKECYSAVLNFGVEAGMDVLVFGDGPAGVGLVTFSRLVDAGWVGCVGHHDERLERAETAGADLAVNTNETDLDKAIGDRRFDVVIDAVGSTSIIKRASQLLKPRGKVGVFGVLKKDDAHISLLDLSNNTAVHMLNWPQGEHELHGEVVEMVLDGRLDPGVFYSHVMPMEQAADAVHAVKTREAVKVVLRM